MTAADGGYVDFNDRPLGGHAVLLRHVLERRPARVLDVGCSSGYLSARLARSGVAVTGVEIDPGAADLAREHCEQVVVADIEGDSLQLPPASFDVVLLGDVIEHLRRPEAALVALRPLLRAGGALVLSTPNVANWAVRLSLLAGRWRYTDRGVLDRTHVHLFTRATLRETLERAGFSPVAWDHTAPVPGLGRPAVERVAHRIAGVRPSLLAYQFVVVAECR